MAEVKYTKEEALKIAHAFHMQGGLDTLVDWDPATGKGTRQTVKTGLDGIMGIGGYGNNPQGRERIWKEMMELPLGNGLTKENYTAQELSEMLKPKGVSIDPAAIDKVGEELKLGTSAPAEKPQESKPPSQAVAEDKPKVQTPATTAEKSKDAAPSKPPTTPPTSTATSEDDAAKGLFRGVSSWYETQKDTFGEDRSPIQFFGFLLYALLTSLLGNPSKDEKRTPETKKAEKTQEVKKEQHQELSQQVQLAQALEAQDEAQKPKLPDPPRELVINHFGEGGIRRNTEDMQKFQEALAQSHVPDGTNVSPSSSVSNSQHQKVGPDASFGRSIV